MEPWQQIVDRFTSGGTFQSVRPLTGGVSAQVRAVTYLDPAGAEQTFVIRQNGDWAYKDNNAVREHELQHALWGLGWPVPEPLGLDVSHELLDTAYTVMSFIEGDSEQPAEALPRVIETMADRLRALHALDTNALPAMPDRLDLRPEIFEFWMEGDTWLPLRTFMEELPDTAYHGTPRLLHGDFWPGNLLWKDQQLVGIIDWEDSAIGDPLSDLACTRQELLWKHGFDAMQRFTDHYWRGPMPDPERQALWDIYSGFAAYRYMGEWGLDPLVVEHMRAMTRQLLGQASDLLLG